MKLIVGLGNPGKKYERTRHNVGFVIVDKLATTYGLRFVPAKKLQADIAKGELESKRVVFLKPETFMNNSGLAVHAALSFYKLTPDDLIVVHDDKDIPLGETRVQVGRGSAGHNGIKSIFECLGTKNFTRIRVGVAPAVILHGDTANFVLSNFTKEEQMVLKEVLGHVTEELKQLIGT